MPSYDYRCDKCGYEGTRVHTMAFSEEIYCMNCEGQPLRKLFTATPAVFKGSGWGSKPQLWTTDSKRGEIKPYKGDIDPGKKGKVDPKYS